MISNNRAQQGVNEIGRNFNSAATTGVGSIGGMIALALIARLLLGNMYTGVGVNYTALGNEKKAAEKIKDEKANKIKKSRIANYDSKDSFYLRHQETLEGFRDSHISRPYLREINKTVIHKLTLK